MAETTLETLDPIPFAFVTRTTPLTEMAKVMPASFAEVGAAFAAAKAQLAGMPMAHYTDYDGSSTTFEAGFPARPEDVEALQRAGLSIGKTAGGRVMKAIHVGPYDEVVSTYDAMTRAMKAQGLTGSRDMWESYQSPPETPPEEIRTEVVWPVHPA